MSIAIDNPLIFLYPKPISADRDQSNQSTSSNHPPIHHRSSHLPQDQPRDHQPQPTLFPSFRPLIPSFNHPNLPHSEHHTTLVDSRVDQLDSRSTILSGSLILKFSKPKEVRKIIISLCGQSYIGFNDRPYEYQTILSKELELDLADQLFNSAKDQHPSPGSVKFNPQHKTFILDKGNYRFNWSFILPPDLPPYERGQFGRTTHKVVAKVKLGSGLGLGLKAVGKNLPSLLLGVGSRGHEIETESYFVAITNPSGNNEDITEDLGLNLHVSEVSEQLGPYTLSASSCYFTVAGLLSFKLKLDEIPKRKKITKIYKIACIIKQQYRLISIKDKDSKTGGPAESWPPCQRRKVFVLDHSNVTNVNKILPNGQLLDTALDRPDVETTQDSPSHDHPVDNFSTFDSSHHSARSSQPTSPSHSRSRSRIRGLLSSSRNNHESSSPERPPQQLSHHSSHPWNGLTSIRLGRRREELPRPEHSNPAREEHPHGIYLSRSADQLESVRDDPSSNSTLSTNQPIPQNAFSSSVSDHPGASPTVTSSNSQNRLQRPRFHSQHSIPSQIPYAHSTSASSHPESHTAPEPTLRRFRSSQLISTPSSLTEQSSSSNPQNRGRQSELVRPPGRSSRDKAHSSRSRGRKSRSEFPRGLSNHLPPEQEVPLVTLTDDHSSWEIEHIGRLPSDDIIRPSTNPGTQTNIHIFHTLLFEIHYSVEDDLTNITEVDSSHEASSQPSPGAKKASCTAPSPSPSITRKVLSIRKPVQISSCCCMVESMILPPYSQYDPNAQFVQHPTPSHAARMFKCVCGMSTDVLLKTQNPKGSQLNGSLSEHQGDSEEVTDQHQPSLSSSAPLPLLLTHSTLRFRGSDQSSSTDCNPQYSSNNDQNDQQHHQDHHDNCMISTK